MKSLLNSKNLKLLWVNALIFIVLFALINGAAWFWMANKETPASVSNILLEKYRNLGNKKNLVYPQLSIEEIGRLHEETWTRGLEWGHPILFFREKTFQGQLVNVHRAGFRYSVDQGPWPPSDSFFNIFLFGGSSVFGYGVEDKSTIASFLQKELERTIPGDRPFKVYNFGQGYYYSSQERLLFNLLLEKVPAPDMAIFLDGLNDIWSITFPDWARVEKRPEIHKRPESILNRLPVYQLILQIRQEKAQMAGEFIKNRDELDYGPVLQEAITLYFDNMSAISQRATKLGIRTLFFWQPIPLYKYDLRYHLFYQGDFGWHSHANQGYQLMAERVRSGNVPTSFVWLADMQETMHEPLYVDLVHYSAKMNRAIAKKMAITIRQQLQQ